MLAHWLARILRMKSSMRFPHPFSIAALGIFIVGCAAGGIEGGEMDALVPPDVCIDCADSSPDAGLPAPDAGEAEVNEVCFPGDGNELCLPLHHLDPLPDELVYPLGPADSYFENNPQVPRENYRAPLFFFDLQEAFEAHGDDVKIYPNFRLDELGQSRVGRWAVIQPKAFDRLQTLREILGPTTVISGYRSPGYNASVGGASTSRHMWGDAFDFKPPVDLQVAKRECEELGAYYINLYTTHIHCDWRHESVDERFFGEPLSLPLPMAMRVGAHDEPLYSASIDVGSNSVLSVDHAGFDEGEPLVEWVALDVHGNVVGSASGPEFAPPPSAARATVTVAGWLVRTVSL
jgi:hypothetical protein